MSQFIGHRSESNFNLDLPKCESCEALKQAVIEAREFAIHFTYMFPSTAIGWRAKQWLDRNGGL